MNMEKELQFSEVPQWWAICQNSGCPVREKCLRHHAATIAPDGTTHPCVIAQPSASGCPYFDEKRTVRIASGLRALFRGVAPQHGRPMRQELMAYLGSKTSKGTYYRYAHGERLLSPRQQAWISQLMQRYGYPAGPTYDRCYDDFCFKCGPNAPEYKPLAG